MVEETGRGNLSLLRPVLERRLSTPWPPVVLDMPALFRGDGLAAKVLLTVCAAAPRERGTSRAKVQQLLARIAGTPHAPESPTVRLRVSYAQLAALLIDAEAPVEAVRRVQRAAWMLEQSGVLALRTMPGSANELLVLPDISGQLSTNLWRHDWIRKLSGAALWIYLSIHLRIHRQGGRIGRKMPPRAGALYMTAVRDLLTDSGLSYPTVMNGLRVLREYDLIREVRRGRDTYVDLVDADLWTRPRLT